MSWIAGLGGALFLVAGGMMFVPYSRTKKALWLIAGILLILAGLGQLYIAVAR